jgi:hypothetical protein
LALQIDHASLKYHMFLSSSDIFLALDPKCVIFLHKFKLPMEPQHKKSNTDWEFPFR